MNKQIFVKKEAIGEFGQDSNKRTTAELIQYGIVNIDKLKGPTSHQTSDYVKKILNIGKAGHSGTLEN
ncbi:MAG: tRNA pseudouridine synthase A [Nanoarchaeota archaeon]|nr:tRNA pseudouridine synthase A [Nanoarchaeota archaeon]MBU1622318.1 tRNA pseudouridine synthase A [Nanoarchaeota archaeon]MBU1974340.1 tRNA pseudouridine synthase A [Nanoarchaeota archaeon]